LRTSFSETVFTRKRSQENHTHGACAAERSSAAPFAIQLADRTGLVPFFYQMSKTDQTSKREGSRVYYWGKDLGVEPSYNEPIANHLITMVDVDYYVDMPSFLLDLKHDNSILMYTMLPSNVASTDEGEQSFTFNQRSQMILDVSGGGHFEHEIWNWSVDTIAVRRASRWHDKDGNTLWNPEPAQLRVYSVDRRQTSKHRGFVFLTPLGRWTGSDAAVVYEALSCTPLTRLSPVQGDFLRMEFAEKGSRMIATALVGNYNAVKIGKKFDEAICDYAETAKVGLNGPGIRSICKDLSKEDSLVLLRYHQSIAKKKAPTVYPVELGVTSYQFEPHNYEPSAKPSLVSFASPLIAECFSPANTVANHRAAVNGRVTTISSTVTPTPIVETLIHEFIDLLGGRQDLHPVEVDDVFDHQKRVTQRHILNQALDLGDHFNKIIRTFVKKEAYGSVKDPRIISTIPARTKLEYSSFTYALAEVFKTYKWYAFGKTPLEIAQHVADLAQSATEHAVNSDLSRFDGRVSPVLRELEKRFLISMFHHEHHTAIIELHRSQFCQKAVTTMGVKYDTGNSRLSGSPETSMFNTLASAFMAYSAFRSMKVNGAYVTPTEAYAKLGLYGGDDGLTFDVSVKCYNHAARRIGQVLTADLVPHGELGIQFLSRFYSPNVWFGDVTSCSDIRRQVSKLHSSHNMPSNVTPCEKLLEKAKSYYLTDHDTPILGQWARKILEIHYGEILVNAHQHELVKKLCASEDKLRLRTWSSKTAFNTQYPNDCSNWAEELVDVHLSDFDTKIFEDWLGECKTLTEILKAPLCVQPKPPDVPAACVVGQQIVGPKPRGKSNHPKSLNNSGPLGGPGSNKKSKNQAAVHRKDHVKAKSSPASDGRVSPKQTVPSRAKSGAPHQRNVRRHNVGRRDHKSAPGQSRPFRPGGKNAQ
jgi:hypothetical protein